MEAQKNPWCGRVIAGEIKASLRANRRASLQPRLVCRALPMTFRPREGFASSAIAARTPMANTGAL